MDAIVILKTHYWTPSVAEFASKLLQDTEIATVDFAILYHTDEPVCDDIEDALLEKIIFVTQTDIESLYDTGFHTMWLSNHWLLMWFFKNYDKYQYYWSIEYDVRISGDSSAIWSHCSDDDLLHPTNSYRNHDHVYKWSYTGTQIADDNKWYGYLQLARYSNRFLDYLDVCFRDGENGHDEMIVFSLIKNHETYTSSCKYLNALIKGTWTWQDAQIMENIMIFQKYQSRFPDVLCIFHPIK